jgi:hypothetical protein
MHWGHKVTLFFIGFICFMLMMLYKCLQQSFDLVAPDYYAKEILFQKQIDQQKNTVALSEKPMFNFSDEHFILSFPENITLGEITFYRPSDARLDISENIKIDGNRNQKFDLKQFKKGVYLIKLSWQQNNKEYYTEEKITFP